MDEPLQPPRGHTDVTEARAAPVAPLSAFATLRLNFFSDWGTGISTALLLLVLAVAVGELLEWAVLRALWWPDVDACRADGAGACWGVIAEKYRVILLGRYPLQEAWRPVLASFLLLGLLLLSCVRACWKPALGLAWGILLPVYLMLMYGKLPGLSLGLTVVDTDRWGGLPLTLLLSSVSIVLAFPLAVAVALGRRSDWPAVRALCTVYVELVRGVPLISVLFMASFMLPLFLPQGLNIDVLVRVLVGITLFAGAYMAEVVRGGLQALPSGQLEAAASLGLSWWQTQRFVVLPQTLRAVLPGLVNNFIAIFKDTSLVTIVSLYELTGALSLALNSDADWRPFMLEGYLFIALIYFVFCFAISRYSLWVERQLNHT
jgi:general L-amino acid transport system permease protein